jgi:ketosteroid isomerase-like protein
MPSLAPGLEKGLAPMPKVPAYNALLFLLAVLAFVSTPDTAQGVRKDSNDQDEIAIEGPIGAFGSVEKAWQSGDAQALANLASDSKILVKIRGMERRGEYFTKPQLYYIFKGMFASTSQTTFTFVRYQNLEKQDGKVYGMAQRSYKSNRNGGLYKDTVYVTLAREGSRWAVTEIKSTW